MNFILFVFRECFFFFGLISEADIVIQTLHPDIEFNSMSIQMALVLERLDSGKFALVSSFYDCFETVIYLNNQIWNEDLTVLEDGDVIEISHSCDGVFQYHPHIIFEGFFSCFFTSVHLFVEKIQKLYVHEFVYLFMMLFIPCTHNF